VNMQEETDSGNPSDCMVTTPVEENGCEVEKPAKRSRSLQETDHSLQENYDTVVSVVALTCSDALFQGICNYLQLVEDAELLK